jgi:6-phosphogluconolactonase/glucosamine-6-phosphate isomerase/deaminase
MIKGEIKRNYDEYLQEVRNYKRNSKSNKQVVEVNKQSEKKGIKEIDTNQKQRTQKNNRLPSKRQIELFVIGCRV